MFRRTQGNPPPISYQTIRLGKGKHTSPRHGVCVMELASMLAGEQFTDQPQSVCPVISSFLRSYNDSIDDRRRQDLYGLASKVVGSRASERTHRARAKRLAAWTLDYPRRHQTRLFRFLRRRETVPRRIEDIGPYAVAEIQKHTDETHAKVLGLVDELLCMGDGRRAADIAAVPARDSEEHKAHGYS